MTSKWFAFLVIFLCLAPTALGITAVVAAANPPQQNYVPVVVKPAVPTATPACAATSSSRASSPRSEKTCSAASRMVLATTSLRRARSGCTCTLFSESRFTT